MSTSSELALLLKKYIDGSILPAEQQQLEKYLADDVLLKEYVEHLLQDDALIADYEDWLASRRLMDEELLESIKNQTLKRIQPRSMSADNEQSHSSKQYYTRLLRIVASAAAAIALFVGLWFVYQQSFRDRKSTRLNSSHVKIS